MKVKVTVAAVLAALALALGGKTTLAEGHFCRHWYPDPYYGGYWLWLHCPPDPPETARWGEWHADLPAYEWSNPYLDIQEPLY